MFITQVRSRGNVYVLLKEGYRDGQGRSRSRVVRNFGRLDELVRDDPEAYEKLKARYAGESKNASALERRAGIGAVLESRSDRGAGEETGYSSPLLRYGHYVIRRIWKRWLTLDSKIARRQEKLKKRRFDVNDAMLYHVCACIMCPSSIYGKHARKDELLGNPARGLDLRSLYASLEYALDWKDEIFDHVNARLAGERGASKASKASLVLYDASDAGIVSPLADIPSGVDDGDFVEKFKAVVLEARINGIVTDECFDGDGNIVVERLPADFLKVVVDRNVQFLRASALAREAGSAPPAIKMALVVDGNGFPMDVAVFTESRGDTKGMKEAIEALKRKYGIVDVLVNANDGVNSVKNLKALRDLGLGFVVAQKLGSIRDTLTPDMLNRERYTPFDPEHPELGCWLAVENWTKPGKGRNGSLPCTLVLTFNERRRARDRAILDAWKRGVEARTRQGTRLGPRRPGWSSMARVGEEKGHPVLGVDEDFYREKLALCGYEAVVCSPPPDGDVLPSALRPGDAVFSYRNQCLIEECFRVLRNNFGTSPLYVWNARHVKGYVVLCVLSLLVVRILQNLLRRDGINMGVAALCRELGQASVVAVPGVPGRFGDGGVSFMSVAYKNFRAGKGFESTAEIRGRLEAGTRPAGIAEILRAAGLSPLPWVASLAELATCLGTRFRSVEEAVPELAMF